MRTSTIQILTAVPLILFPYNVIAWSVGAALYYGKGEHRSDASGDGYLYGVLMAPTSLPLALYLRLKESLS